MPLKQRIAIFTLLWVVAGLLSAIFAEFSPEAGQSEFATRAAMVYLAPLCLAQGLEFVVMHGRFNELPDRQFWEQVVAFGIVAIFVTHAVMTLTRRTRRQFITWSAIQFIFLSAGVASYLYYWHWDALNHHG